MALSQFFMPSNNLLGAGALDEAVRQLGESGFRKALIVTDAALARMGLAQTLADKLLATLDAPDVFSADLVPAIVTHTGPGALGVGFFLAEAA